MANMKWAYRRNGEGQGRNRLSSEYSENECRDKRVQLGFLL
jgi:hypothetical protein